MNARIDIKTPAGKSLEGFPQNIGWSDKLYGNSVSDIADFISDYAGNGKDSIPSPELNKGDIITIEVL